MPTITIDVDVDLDEFSDDDLRDELSHRGIDVPADFSEFLDDCRDLLKLGKEQDAMTRLRTLVSDHFGVVL